MKGYFASTLLLGLAAAAPTAQSSPPKTTTNAIVYVRLIGNSNQHYSAGDTQTLSTSGGSIIPVLVGQSLDFSSNAPQIQEIEISRVAPGLSLGGTEIVEDDSSIICKASLNGSSSGQSFSIEETRIPLNEGKVVKLTGLTCWVEPGRI